MINFTNNDSEIVLKRKMGMDSFIFTLSKHFIIKTSAELFSFLTDRDEDFEAFKEKFTKELSESLINQALANTLFTDQIYKHSANRASPVAGLLSMTA